MAKAGQNRGNKHAALKTGELGRIQFTYSLSGEVLQNFVRSLNIDPGAMSEQALREAVASAARKKIQEMFDAM